MTSNQGPFHASKPPSKPLDSPRHQPGHKSSPSDSIPTFSASTLTPGTAPAEHTYTAQTGGETVVEEGGDRALDDIPGTTSRDVHTGLGKPVQGMTSQEVRHDGQRGRKKQELGLAKHGAAGEMGGVREAGRGIERGEDEERKPGRGDKLE